MGRALFLSLVFVGGCATQQHSVSWDAEAIARLPNAYTRLQGREQGQVIATIRVDRVKALLEIANKIQGVAGTYAHVYLIEGTEPNAFSTSKDGKNYIAVNLAMLELIEGDQDATAALIGHETAHLVLNHGNVRRERENVRMGASQVLGTVLSVAGVPLGGSVASLATTAVERTFTRDEERDADRYGIDYARQAGFDPMGAVRLWASMASRSTTNPLAFLSTHPSSDERQATMRQLAGTGTVVPKAPPPQVALPQEHVTVKAPDCVDATSALRLRGTCMSSQGCEAQMVDIKRLCSTSEGTRCTAARDQITKNCNRVSLRFREAPCETAIEEIGLACR
jgi:predicted Zn-dependent protease